jgi:hypothetical protein
MVTLLTGLAAVTCFALGSCLAARMTRPSDRTDGVLTGAVIFSGAVFLSAEGLSAVRLLAAVGAWALMGLLFLGATLAAALLHRPMREIVFRPVRIPGRDSLLRVGERGPAEKRLLLLMGTVLSVGVVVNLALAVAAEPCTPDVLDYHLARVAYWLQNGSTGYFVSPQAPHNAYLTGRPGTHSLSSWPPTGCRWSPCGASPCGLASAGGKRFSPPSASGS